MSLVTLIRCATGEKWNLIMKELAVTNEQLNHRKRLGLIDNQDLREQSGNDQRGSGLNLRLL